VDWNDVIAGCETIRRAVRPPAVLLGPLDDSAEVPAGPGSQPPFAAPSQLGPAVLAPVRCAGTTACRVSLKMTALVARKRGTERVRAGSSSADLPAGALQLVRVPLSARSARLLRSFGTLRVRVNAAFSDGRRMARPIVLRR
jgi:hypothetical protein